MKTISTMKSISCIIVALAAVDSLTNCTTYIEPEISPPTASTTTVTRTTEDPYGASGSVTTRKTTTTY
jgi:hypothetical protein